MSETVFKSGDKIKEGCTGRIGHILHFIESGCQGSEAVIRLTSGDEIKANSVWFGVRGGWNHTVVGVVKSPFRKMMIKIKMLQRKYL